MLNFGLCTRTGCALVLIFGSSCANVWPKQFGQSTQLCLVSGDFLGKRCARANFYTFRMSALGRYNLYIWCRCNAPGDQGGFTTNRQTRYSPLNVNNCGNAYPMFETNLSHRDVQIQKQKPKGQVDSLNVSKLLPHGFHIFPG